VNLLSTFQAYIKQHRLFNANDKLLLAVSGGVDSIVLADLCHRAGLAFEIAHVNFQLRGEESDADEKWVEQLAMQYGVSFHVKRFDTQTVANQKGNNIQIAARQLRYDWFNELIAADAGTSLKYVLTAHHASDNAETVLMHFLKGTGIRGLKGMTPVASGIGGHVVRPLLFATRRQIEDYARAQHLQWREDASNASDYYTRNVIRNEWLPMIQKHIPEVEENLLDNIKRLSQTATIYEDTVNKWLRKVLIKKGNEIHIPVLRLKHSMAPDTFLYEMINPYGFNSRQLATAMSLLEAESGKYVDSVTHRLLRNRNWLILTPLHYEASQHILIQDTDREVSFNDKKISISITSKSPTPNPEEAYLNMHELQYPLILRKWKEGDYFYPLGMKKKKKISKFLIDQKMPLHQKSNIWVLESSNRIVWVVGMRIDDRFKALQSNQELMHLKISSTE